MTAAMVTNRPDPNRTGVRKFRFGSFEVDLQQQELYNRGIRIALQQERLRPGARGAQRSEEK